MDILEFAKLNNLVLDIKWLPELSRHKLGADYPWIVSLVGTAIEKDSVGRYKMIRGQAKTIDGAILDYVAQIKGATMISDPFAQRQFNIRIQVPADLNYRKS